MYGHKVKSCIWLTESLLFSDTNVKVKVFSNDTEFGILQKILFSSLYKYRENYGFSFSNQVFSVFTVLCAFNIDLWW